MNPAPNNIQILQTYLKNWLSLCSSSCGQVLDANKKLINCLLYLRCSGYARGVSNRYNVTENRMLGVHVSPALITFHGDGGSTVYGGETHIRRAQTKQTA